MGTPLAYRGIALQASGLFHFLPQDTTRVNTKSALPGVTSLTEAKSVFP